MKARRSKCCAPRRIQMRDLCLALLWTFWSRRLVCKEKPRKCFVWNFDPWTRGAFFEPILYACRMCWLPLRPETAVKESEAAQLGPLKKIFQWFRHDAPNQAWRTDVADGCLTRFCKISWFQERERERERKCSNLANAWCLNCCLQHNENWRKVLCKKCLPQSLMNTLMIIVHYFFGGVSDQGEKEAGVKSCELPVKDWRMNSMFDRLIKFDNVWCLNNIPSFSLLSIQLQHLRTTWCHRVDVQDVQTSIGGRVWAWERRHSGEALDALTLTLCWWHRAAEIEVVKR